jgi:hypothetical protein
MNKKQTTKKKILEIMHATKTPLSLLCTKIFPLLPLRPLSNRQQHTNVRTPTQHKHDDTTKNVTTPPECDDTQWPPHQTVSKAIQP